jgi:hypothetical protein
MGRLYLGEAIQLGRALDNQDGTANDLVVLALKAHGDLPPDLNGRNYRPKQHNNYAYSSHVLIKRHPWLKEKLLCPWCAEKLTEAEIVQHPQREHVSQSEADIEEECEWLIEMEEEEERRPLGVAIYFQTADERDSVIYTARRQKLTLNAFLAAAVRLVMIHRLEMAEFARPDPKSMYEGGGPA